LSLSNHVSAGLVVIKENTTTIPKPGKNGNSFIFRTIFLEEFVAVWVSGERNIADPVVSIALSTRFCSDNLY
jgi:hypothetical protein